MIDVRLRPPNAKKGGWSLAGFAGGICEVKRTRVGDAWVAWLEEDGQAKPTPGHVLLDRRTFENAWTQHDGSTLTLSIRGES